MTARRALVLGAIAVAGVLAAVGGVAAQSDMPRPVGVRGQAGVTPSEGLLEAFSVVDRRLQRLIDDVQGGRITITQSFDARLNGIVELSSRSLLLEALEMFPQVWGCAFDRVFRLLESADTSFDSEIRFVSAHLDARGSFPGLGYAKLWFKYLDDRLRDNCPGTPAGVRAAFDKLRQDTGALDKQAEAGTVTGEQLVKEIKALRARKEELVRANFPDIFGIAYRSLLETVVAIQEDAQSARVQFELGHTDEAIAAVEKLKQRKVQLEMALNQAAQNAQVTISEDDTWAHNPDIGKSRICINVRTSPPQALVAAKLTGPGGFSETTPAKEKLHADGSAQIRAIITQAGDYTKTLWVYDANGNQTATVTKTFTVAAPPQDGPATTPPCQKPTR